MARPAPRDHGTSGSTFADGTARPGFFKATGKKVAALIGLLATLGGWATWDRIRAFEAADVHLGLNCNVNKIVLIAWNEGGHVANIDTPSFQMLSEARWGDRRLH